METVIDEINSAAKTLGLVPQEFRELPAAESEKIFFEALHHFVASGDRRWWWEDFREQGTSVMFPAGDGWKLMPEIAPNPDELVWFIAEDDQLPHYPVFETTPRIATQIIGECCGFEFYLIAKNFEWLICETHHNRVCAVGSVVEQRLNRLPNPAINPTLRDKAGHGPMADESIGSGYGIVPVTPSRSLLFDKAVADSEGRRWVKDEDGIIHRFSKPSNGETHWNGSTGGEDPIRTESIPIEIRRQLR